MRRTLFTLCLLTILSVLSCRKDSDSAPEGFFIKLKIDGQNIAHTEQEAIGSCFTFISTFEGEDKLISIYNVCENGLNPPMVSLGIRLKTTLYGNAYRLTTGLENGNGILFYNGSNSYQETSHYSMARTNLLITITKDEPPGGYLEGTLKGTVARSTDVTGGETIWTVVPVEGSFRVLSK